VNTLVITEDFRKDQYIAKPIVEAMLAAAGKPRAKVAMYQGLWGGVSRVMDWHNLEGVLQSGQAMVDLFLLLVDRDDVATRRAALDALEARAAQLLVPPKMLLAENAWQEIEVWALAGQTLPRGMSIKEIRAHEHPKEAYFEPLAEALGLSDELGGGRWQLGRDAGRHYSRVRSRCPEDVAALENRIKQWLESIP
jgi:hypothetical protein